MGTLFLKIFVGFWAIWIAWYLTGGPLRDDKTHPYIDFSKTSTTTISGSILK
jgi:hypothetical protein